MSLSKEQYLVDASINMNRSMWAMNLDTDELKHMKEVDSNITDEKKRDEYIYHCVSECLKDLKSAKGKYGDKVRHEKKRKKG